MKFYDVQVYDKNVKLLAVANLLMKDKSHNFMCDSLSIEYDGVMYITSYNYYDITVKYRDDLYIVSIYDYTNGEKKQFTACSIHSTARIIRNVFIFHDFYKYSYMYEYLLQGQYKITLSLIGCDSINIHIMDVDTFKITASMEVRRISDGSFKYRYFGGYGEYLVSSPNKLIREFLERWV